MSKELPLTDQQKAGIEFLKGPARIKLIHGAAGTGKSTLIGKFTKGMRNVAQVTPTHKAAEVLRKLSHHPVHTLHSFLNVNRKLRYGKYVFEPSTVRPIVPRGLTLICDEISMVEAPLLDIVEQLPIYVNIVLVGDNRQLPPVGRTQSPAFFRHYEQFELTEILRTDTDIIDLSRNLDWIYEQRNGENFHWCEDNDKLFEYLVDSNGSDYAKAVCWTRASVAMINREVRNAIYGSDVWQFMKDETILLTRPFEESYKNNEEVRIIGWDEKTTDVSAFSRDLPHKEIRCLYVNGDLRTVYYEDWKKHAENCRWMKQECLDKRIPWRIYYKYIEHFAEYQFNHALTTHRAQGSTFKKSIVHATGIVSNPCDVTRAKMLYTAITRASEEVILV